jgi:large subunit ribosomal protein L22
MKINHAALKKLVKDNGLTADALADALPKDSDRRKQRDIALESVQNWINGKDHPRATKADIEAMAAILGVEASRIAIFSATKCFVRSAPRKARLVADLIRGRRVDEANGLLQFSPKRAAVPIKRALSAAVAEAEASEANLDRLVISVSEVSQGPTIKRFQPKDRGRAHPIKKKTSHITIGVREVE